MYSQLQVITFCRYLGNALGIIGYFVLLNYDPLLGSSIKIMATLLIIPFCIKLKLWDVILVFSFYSFLDLSNILKLI